MQACDIFNVLESLGADDLESLDCAVRVDAVEGAQEGRVFDDELSEMDEVAKVMQILAVKPPRDDLFQRGQRGDVSRITLQSACTCVRFGRSVRSIVASGAACTERLSSVPASREIGVRSRMPRSSRFRRRIGHASRNSMSNPSNPRA